MPLDLDLLPPKGQLSPLMQQASSSDDELQKILELLRQAGVIGAGPSPANPLTKLSPLGQPYLPMTPGEPMAPPGYRLNSVDPRLMQVLQSRMGG